MCYIYVNAAEYKGKSISKVGISNNVKKRLVEFNNGLRYRSNIFEDLVGIEFHNVFSFDMGGRELAKLIEYGIISSHKGKLLLEFGREVLSVEPEVIVRDIISLTKKR